MSAIEDAKYYDLTLEHTYSNRLCGGGYNQLKQCSIRMKEGMYMLRFHHAFSCVQ